MWLSGLFNQKEAEVPGYHIQQVCHMDSLSLMCSLSARSDKWATKLFLRHVMKFGGHHIDKPGRKGQRFLPCAEVALTSFDIQKSIRADPRRGKVHIRSERWGGAGWGPWEQTLGKTMSLPATPPPWGSSLQFSFTKKWGEVKEMTRSRVWTTKCFVWL